MTGRDDHDHDHEAVLSFPYADRERARVVERSVRREVDDIGGDRTAATLAREAAAVEVTVTARDLTALRAGVNTWTTLVSVAERSAAAGCGD